MLEDVVCSVGVWAYVMVILSTITTNHL